MFKQPFVSRCAPVSGGAVFLWALAAACFVSSAAAQEVDDYGDPLPPGAARRLGTVSLRHGGWIDCVAFLPDGKSVVSGAADGLVCVWDLTTGKQTVVIDTTTNGLQGGPRFAVSPNGRTLATAAPELLDIDLYDLTTGGKTGVVARRDEVGGSTHSGNVHAVSFFPDGRRLATAGDRTVKIWQWPDIELREFDKQEAVDCLAVSPDGKFVASGEFFGDGWVLLWNAETGNVVHRLRSKIERRKRMVLDVCFSPDGRMLAAAEQGAYVCLWDVATGRPIRDFRLGGRSYAGVVFTPDSRHLVIGASGARESVGQTATPPNAAPASGEENGPIVGEIGLWEVETGQPIRRFEGLPQGAVCVALSPDGRHLAAGGHDCVVGVWDFESGTPLLEKPEPKTAIECLAIDPYGKLLACGMHDGTVRLRHVGGGPARGAFRASRYKVNDVCLSYDGRLVAAVGTNRKLDQVAACVWRVDDARLLHRSSCGREMGTAVAISPDGRLFAAANAYDRQVRLWDLGSGALVHEFSPLPEKTAWRIHVAFTPDSQRLIAWNSHNVAQTWDVASGKPTAEGRGGNVGNYASACSPDGRWIVNGGFQGKIQIWSPESDGPVQIMNEEAGPESCCCFATAFSHDQRYVATAHHPIMDRKTRGTPQPPQIRIWELVSGCEVMRFKGHRGRVHALVFAANFRELISGGWDTTALVWSLDPFTDVNPWSETEEPQITQPAIEPAVGSHPYQSAPVADSSGGLDEPTLSGLWEQLTGNAPLAYRAKWRLIHHPTQAIRLFAKHVKPVPFDPTEPRRWAAQLDDGSFAVREAAFQRLAGLGELAAGVLRDTLEQDVSLEVKTRINRLLAAQHPILIEDKETLRVCRAIEVIERIGSPEARELIDRLATGAAEATITRHAQAAKARLGRTSVCQRE